MACDLCEEIHGRGPAGRLNILRARNEELGLHGLRGQNLRQRARGIRLRMAVEQEEAECPKMRQRDPLPQAPGARKWDVSAAKRIGIPVEEYVAHRLKGERRCGPCGAWGPWSRCCRCPSCNAVYQKDRAAKERAERVPTTSRIVIRPRAAMLRRWRK